MATPFYPPPQPQPQPQLGPGQLTVPTFGVTPPPSSQVAWAPPVPPQAPPLAAAPVRCQIKSEKYKKKRYRSSSCSSDDDEKCEPCPPATQIFISPPQNAPPQQCGNYGECGEGWGPMCNKCNCPKRPDAGQTAQVALDPYNICVQKCWGLQGGYPDAGRTQVVRQPSQLCLDCQKQSRKKSRTAKNCCYCCCCGSESKKKKKSQEPTLTGIMPATQQFLMFLQAYGLATALIKDRCRREEEWQME